MLRFYGIYVFNEILLLYGADIQRTANTEKWL